jgi:hypothetical protein
MEEEAQVECPISMGWPCRCDLPLYFNAISQQAKAEVKFTDLFYTAGFRGIRFDESAPSLRAGTL